ncbi:hypothetical protein [Vannielia litorea]|uniref:hypothetical protein n=1 Tax=Vannielia litorea TaxID=1217970 RepID=UPI001BD00289|nr:hypothetical protein [Vannielia litorea]MBS8228406.1 hypothetical protein [Vannielia litorea]
MTAPAQPNSILDAITADFRNAPLKEVPSEKWGCTFYFRPLSLAKRRDIGRGVASDDHEELVMRQFIACALDAQGKRIFDDSAETKAALQGGADANEMIRIIGIVNNDGAAEGDAKND